MNDNDYFDYFLEMGAMRPEDEKARRKQAMVDYLRAGSLQAPQAQQAGRVVVAPSWTQNLAQVAQGYMANRQQGALDEQYGQMTQQRRQRLEELRRRRGNQQQVAEYVPSGMGAVTKRPYEEDPFFGVMP